MNQLEHRRDTTSCCNHSNPVDVALHHFLALIVPHHELRVAIVVHVSTNRRHLHLLVAVLYSVEELSEDATLLVLKVSQVDLDQEIHVTGVRHFGQRMVESFKLLALDYGLELEVLASHVAKRGVLLRQCKPVNEGVCSQLILRDQSHRDWIVQFLKDTTVLYNLCRIN